jgi:hypothetical protein
MESEDAKLKRLVTELSLEKQIQNAEDESIFAFAPD